MSRCFRRKKLEPPDVGVYLKWRSALGFGTSAPSARLVRRGVIQEDFYHWFFDLSSIQSAFVPELQILVGLGVPACELGRRLAAWGGYVSIMNRTERVLV